MVTMHYFHVPVLRDQGENPVISNFAVLEKEKKVLQTLLEYG